MAVKDAVVSLVLKAKNAISPSADDATESLRDLDNQAEQLYDELKELEKQQAAAKGWKEVEENAKGTSKALEKAVTAYENLKNEGKQAGQTQAQYALAVRQARTAQSIANTEYNRNQLGNACPQRLEDAKARRQPQQLAFDARHGTAEAVTLGAGTL